MSRPAQWVTLVCTIVLGANAQHQQIPDNEILRYEAQPLAIADFPAKGYVLDIGGGGEGIIGLLKPSQVVAIDLFARELREAPPGPLKIVMDARDLKFLDASLPTVTAFCTLMYVPEADHAKVFAEVFRVLEPGGRFLLWEGIVPAAAGEKKWTMFRLSIQLPNRDPIGTGYGVPMGTVLHDAAYFQRLAQHAGFTVSAPVVQSRFFALEFRKP